MTKDERPEALAQFAESARRGERAGVTGPRATKVTEPIPTDPEAKQDAATRILAEGATGEDLDSEEAVDALPDRILESQEKSEEKETDETAQEVVFDQAPGRMASPRSTQESMTDFHDEAVRILVAKGISREAAMDLIAEMGPPSAEETLEEWGDRITGIS